jgi:hypothetical protein
VRPTIFHLCDLRIGIPRMFRKRGTKYTSTVQRVLA